MRPRFSDVKPDYYPLGGGLDLLTPAIAMPPGKVISAQNYEPEIGGGYKRIKGYERYSGKALASSKSYWLATVALSGAVAVGDTITGVSSSATGVVIAIESATVLVLAVVTGTFVAETIQVSASNVGTVSAVVENDAASPSDHADYKALAAENWRSNINGLGTITGLHHYGGSLYAFFEDGVTVGGASITIASPAVINIGGSVNEGAKVVLTTTGALPTGLTAGTTYYCINVSGSNCNLSATPPTLGGVAINTSGTQSGVHTATVTRANISKATASGWSAVTLGSEIQFTGAVGEITAGQTITGLTSGATALVVRALLRTGTWTVSGAGTLVISTITGTWQSGESVRVGGVTKVTSSSLATNIYRVPGGTLDAVTANFTGSTDTKRIYGADGVNHAFEFDGTNYIPIRTGMAVDTPSHAYVHKNHFFLSFRGSSQNSSIGQPYAWTVVTGASEIATGDDITGYLAQSGSATAASLAIFTEGKTFTLYGNSSSDWQLSPSGDDIGAFAFCFQPIGNDTMMLTNRGIQRLRTVQDFGNFAYTSVSDLVQPIITAKRSLSACSTTLKTRNQYRVFFSDGTALTVGLTGNKISGITPLDYGTPITCVCTAQDADGNEVTWFGSSDGYVYQDNSGTSFDGDPIEAWIRLPFNNQKGPRVRKRYRAAILEGVCQGYSEISVTYLLGYGTIDVEDGVASTGNLLVGGGGFWDDYNYVWDQFVWDAQAVANPRISLDGTEKNISLLFYSNRYQDDSHTIQGVTIMSSALRLER